MLIKVKVFPNSQKEEVVQSDENTFEIKVRERPVQGKANARARTLLAEYLKIPPENLWLKKGARQRNKIFEILAERIMREPH
ncbi:MAG: hypothetical protein AUJ32_03165 [Parcubacteria group bacterium CG1_02_40_82]|uniref:UPF0235 protein CO001_02975 n=4 Tax=Candidatus Portnoyibacteriota TaxID=1817913 RepID=A0A2M7II49_9BACT|nr:MAG: hypothetical protein AUJ32_03165 [Parcubacteria group bacterium CG1_02_40_82]PIQ75180.1 MAG: hypothetical protein COV84_02425 [Candidatus Portnoybacteria bacterium CG11_big_fil_rev_8_21_14_0_20_40_15]PIS31452.1 MAG: hypothetical protein COT41_01820 [Candidatus Portnoybacteria bacterium CG08_land_8_20_14_0_20_40_83]PIW76151.1 MAG: hypothetical protein CO001_02975 [Candidatus Portnoybacteria bacterium CG_4_8_14_3_um_filter_40_10]PIY75246.1 MAG: hypothetical protein COY85_00905 [Candidatus